MYLDFEFYKENGGTTTDQVIFNKFNRKAQNYINLHTFNRLIHDEVNDTIRFAALDLLDFLISSDAALNNVEYLVDGVPVKTVNNNGISLTLGSAYGDVTSTLTLQEQEDFINKTVSEIMQRSFYGYRNCNGEDVLYRGI